MEKINKKYYLEIQYLCKPKNPIEILALYKSKFPCISLQKLILFIIKSISYCCKVIISNQFFDSFILLIIIANSIFLAFDDPTTDKQNLIQNYIEDFFLWTYTIEAIIKIIGMGFIFNQGAYLRDRWNILDFIIVISSLIPLVASDNSVNLNSLRSFRILRPLRAISTIRSLKVLLSTLFQALPDLINTLIILVFMFFIFAIAGLQLFQGMLKKRCFYADTGIPDNRDILCGGIDCPQEGQICGKLMQNPDYGVTNFDDILYSFLMVFQCVTLEGWTSIMFYLFDTFSIYTIFYFVCLIFFGSFFLLNLMLAVIKASFSDNQGEPNKEEKEEQLMSLDILKEYRKKLRFEKFNFLKDYKIPSSMESIIHNKQQIQEIRKTGFTWEGLQFLLNQKNEENKKLQIYKKKSKLQIISKYGEREKVKKQNKRLMFLKMIIKIQKNKSMKLKAFKELFIHIINQTIIGVFLNKNRLKIKLSLWVILILQMI
ncbi:hypothetical protein IMG5_072540 [Ichthyophthirius multifiliis]|uniref:Ion transport domain-containing protein n=1 Tax=Ichthyophthirius multifiliis TaxID=5932 RepID=G0QPX8_ICHMU|nr:hypothetical protein IMG5_072540 [Ichthyophthirius multifiliis]EGR32726.1 hypothetical protein IMG5_072540 [Ichthyophthirius multifiliis]|eukprot:XP_004036712.1 hypothetical protein IMG5_072540 [Ichthyophthirius multifiliis]